jgi:HlyD family secretion protein
MRLSKGKTITGIAVVALMVFISVFLASGKNSSNTEESIKFKEVKVERGTFEVKVSANGIVKPIDRIEMKSKASGEVVELPVEEGDFIHKGDLIARLDQKDERANFEQAQADLDIANAQLTQAQRTYDRREQLFQSNLISEEERDQIVLNLAVAKGKVVQAKTALERAKERLSEAVVRAPIDGIILQKYVEQGQIIASGINNVGGGTPIVDIADMASVYIEAGIDEVDIGKIKVGQTATVIADAYPNLLFHGKIVRIDPEATVEQNVTLFDVIIEVQNTDGKLKSGMNTSIEITIQRQDSVLLAPTVALQMNRWFY